MQHFPRPPRALALTSVLLLAGCATPPASRFPSLLPREIERRSDAEAVTPVAVAEPDSALDAKLAELSTMLGKSRSDFAKAAARAETLARAARGSAIGSDRWLDAQTALAELDVFRANSSAFVTDLDEILIARGTDGKPPYPALEAARASAQAELDGETATISRLQAVLPQA